MPQPTTDFDSLPDEYQHIIRLAQDTHGITIAPLELLVGGWSGAVVYLVSVSTVDTGRVEHCILKLDRKGKNAKSDEVTRHNAVMRTCTPQFAREHVAELVHDRVEHDGVIAILYRIAGQSLLKYRPLSSYERQSQLEAIFARTNAVLLDEWNGAATFEQAVHPSTLLQRWLGFRLDAGGNTERFLRETRGVDPEVAGLLVNGHVFPNPLFHARRPDAWGRARPIDVATGFIHGDLNTNNILVRFSEDRRTLDGYYLIDFALFKEQMPLLYDQRYLEMSYVMHVMAQVPLARCVTFLSLLAVADTPDPLKVPIEMAGVSAVIGSARAAFAAWVEANHPSLHDDLWGQYWLAGVAAGLAYCHKAGQPDESRLAGLIYAAANLRRYAAIFRLPPPSGVAPLYDESRGIEGAPIAALPRRPHHNLPAQPTRFIGRDAEIAAIRGLLLDSNVRLVTLLGPGGTGKTRLAVQVAGELLDRFEDGVHFVDLVAIRDPEAVLPAIARTIGVREVSGHSLLDDLRDQLQTRTMLLLLDNCEQVTAAAQKVGELLQACPLMKVLTTSREALHLRGEHVHPVSPLALPRADFRLQSVEQLSQYEAVRLFIERVLAVKPDFAVTNANAPAIAEICFRLDGLPLAIELAAARISLLSPQALLERLGSRLQMLRGGARDLPVRQQTLRGTIGWSHDMLDADEQRLFALLSVFSGCRCEAVEGVAARIPEMAPMKAEVLDRLGSLVDKSLLRQVDQDGGEPRLVMLETIREYAAERLDADAGFAAAARLAHASYFADVAQRQVERLAGDAREAALSEMQADIDNLRTAWRYWVDVGHFEQLGKFVSSLGSLYDARGWYHDTVNLTNDLLTVLASTPATPERAREEILLQTNLARALLVTRGYSGEAERAYERALELSERAGEIPELFPILRGLAAVYALRAEFDKALQMGQRILQLAEQVDDVEMRGTGNLIVGYNSAFLGDPRGGLANLEAAIASHDPRRGPVQRVAVGTNGGVIGLSTSALFHWMLGYPDRARARSSESIRLARELHHPYSIAHALFHDGLLHVWLSSHDVARERAAEVLDLAQSRGFEIWNAIASCLLGSASVGLGAHESGVNLIERGLQTYQGLRTPPVFWPMLLHLAAGAYEAASKPDAGLPLINEAIAIGSAGSARTLTSEFLILKGGLLLARPTGDAAEAEALFRMAVANADQVGVPMLELRAAVRLSRLWLGQGRKDEARSTLSRAYSKLDEGLTTHDLVEARALLGQLA